MIDVEANLKRFDCGQLVKLLILFDNRGDQEALVFQFELSFPVSVLHLGGAKKSVNSISLEQNNPYWHSVDIISHELGTHSIGIKILCLNKPHLSKEMKIPVIVVEPKDTVKEQKQGSKETKEVNENKSSGLNSSELLNLIRNSFDLSELKTLCLELSVDYEDITGSNKTEKIGELILYFKRRGRLLDLVNCCRNSRPNLIWPPK